MARQKLGPKKVEKLRTLTGMDIVAVLVRGGTDHRQDLCLADGSVVCRWPDGNLVPSDIRHTYQRAEVREKRS